jgi:hypothetical protein
VSFLFPFPSRFFSILMSFHCFSFIFNVLLHSISLIYLEIITGSYPKHPSHLPNGLCFNFAMVVHQPHDDCHIWQCHFSRHFGSSFWPQMFVLLIVLL